MSNGNDLERENDGTAMEAPESSSRAAKIIAVVVLVIAIATAIGQAMFDGLTGALEGAIFVFIAAVLVYGVFRGELEAPPVQAAFGVGLAAYASLLYLTGGSLLWLALAAVGVVLAARNLTALTD